MTDKQTPPDWVLIEAAKRSKWTVLDVPTLRAYHGEYSAPYRALCDMIERHEVRPVDRKLLCAREAYRGWWDDDESDIQAACVRAIELWESGYGA